jgi:hypothetical protein
MANGNNENIGNKIDDVLSYPILTEEVRHPGPYRPEPSGSPGYASPGYTPYGKIVENALRDILGWRVRESDPKGFVAALNQSFHLADVEGHTEWQWMPHTYAIDAELGAVTGAQAALYARAKAALNQALPLLNGLRALLPASDDQDIEAMSAIVRSSLTELVKELGEEGGPTLSRVDQYFDLLLGSNSNLTDTEQVGGQLGKLRDAYGLVRRNVNTIAEEQDLTNFLILVDYVNSLKLTWDAQRDFFDRQGTDVFLGTQLVLLSRTLAVVAESVQEAYFAMDSVFLGPAERRVTKLDLGTNPPIFIGELLSWVERFALEEGPRLLREGGKEGIIQAFGPTVAKLNNLVKGAAEESANNSSNPTPGFHTPRVQRAFEELSVHLNTTLKLANSIRRVSRPSINAVDPEELTSGETVRVTINGADFQPGAKVRLNESGVSQDEILSPKVLFVDQAEIKATFDLTGIRGNTRWTVVVINPDGQYDTLKRAIRVNPAPAEPEPPPPPQPTVSGFKPKQLSIEGEQSLNITGTNLDPANTRVILMGGTPECIFAPSTSVQRATLDTLVAIFDLSGIQQPTEEVMVMVVSNKEGHTSIPQGTLKITSKTTAAGKPVSAAKGRRKK